MLGTWIVLSPWIWGYSDASGAIATDLTAGAVAVVTAATAIVFPALATLNLATGTWLAIAPWLIGYGDANGPVGVSDVVVGLAIGALSLGELALAARRLRAGRTNTIARLRAPD